MPTEATPPAAVPEESRRHEPVDEDALEELDLYINNTSELYPKKKAILANLSRHLDRGDYDPGKAVKLWAYWVETGAKMYAKEYAKPEEWNALFPKPLRDALAHRVAERAYTELMIQRATRGAVAGERATVFYEDCGCSHTHPPSVPSHPCVPIKDAGARRATAEARKGRPRVPQEFDAFTVGYIEAAVWSSTDDEGRPLDTRFGAFPIASIGSGTLAAMKRDCKEFQKTNAKLLTKAYAQKVDGKVYGPDYAGYDFWLTRNHHGAGFWDRGLGQLGDDLTEAAKAMGRVDLYIGDDGLIHASNALPDAPRATEGTKTKRLKWHADSRDSRVAPTKDGFGYRIDHERHEKHPGKLVWVLRFGDLKLLKRKNDSAILGVHKMRKLAKADAERRHASAPAGGVEANDAGPACAPFDEIVKNEPAYNACMKAFAKYGPVLEAKDVYRAVHKEYERLEQESFRVLTTDVRGHVRGYKEIAKGQRDRVAIGMDDTMRYVLKTGGKRVFIMHNHPSGDPDPSPKDEELTKKVQEACAFFDTELVDHVVIGRGKYYSFKDGRIHKA